jgi:hypothetical protein
LAPKFVGVNLADPRGGGDREEGWSTLDKYWLEMEAIKDEETFFLNVALGGAGEDDAKTEDNK